MKAFPLIAIGAASLLGITACSSGRTLTSPPAPKTVSTATVGNSTVSTDTVGNPGISLPEVGNSGVSLPSDGSVPEINIPANIPGLGKDCIQYIQAFALAFAGDKASLSGLAGAFDKLSNAVPPELKGDVKILSESFTKLATLYAKYNYDYSKIATDPEAQTIFGDKKFTDASDHLTNWLDTQCNAGS